MFSPAERDLERGWPRRGGRRLHAARRVDRAAARRREASRLGVPVV